VKRRGEKEKETNGERNDVAVIVANASFQTMEVFLSTFSTRSKSNIAVNIVQTGVREVKKEEPIG